MLFGIPLFGDRVAPRCTIADSLLIVKGVKNDIAIKKQIPIVEISWFDLLKLLIDRRVDILVCGGINIEDKELAHSKGISIIDNVAGSQDDIVAAIRNKQLKSGFGFSEISGDSDIEDFYNNIEDVIDGQFPDVNVSHLLRYVNCINCPELACERGEDCPYISDIEIPYGNSENERMINSAIDIALEEERQLCRLSELIYYALEMKYKKIGIAFCTELREPAEILYSVLSRFFDVYPICCKILGNKLTDLSEGENVKIACNPIAQAEILNKIGTDLNIIVGLCIGSDCLFTDASKAPVTTLFVKDKSLANNPIGALYSEYYLREVNNSIL